MVLVRIFSRCFRDYTPSFCEVNIQKFCFCEFSLHFGGCIQKPVWNLLVLNFCQVALFSREAHLLLSIVITLPDGVACFVWHRPPAPQTGCILQHAYTHHAAYVAGTFSPQNAGNITQVALGSRDRATSLRLIEPPAADSAGARCSAKTWAAAESHCELCVVVTAIFWFACSEPQLIWLSLAT